LRERPEDIPLLLDYYTSYFAKKFRKPITGIEPATLRQLRQYPFPGNVRELQNMVERAVILCDGNRLAVRHFSFPSDHKQETLPVTIREGNFNLDQLIKTTIRNALDHTNHNKSEAAKLLGISRHALDRRLKKYEGA
jgi:DNA-binding NtrC family response regulator